MPSSTTEDIIIKKPAECSDGELQQFIALVLAGGQVAAAGLEAMVREAAFLVFFEPHHGLRGIAALKRPRAAYRRSIARKAGVALDARRRPYELGWIYLTPDARGAGLSRKLVCAAVAAAGGAGLFATSRVNNLRMHRTLERCGLVRSGRPYRSTRGDYELQLFVRDASKRGGAAVRGESVAPRKRHRLLGC